MVVGAAVGQDTLDANRTQYYNAPSKGTRNPNIGIYDPDYALTPALSSMAAANSDFLHGRLTSTLAVYRIDGENTLSSFSCIYSTCYSQVGKARSQGAALYCNRQDYVFTFKVENLFDKIYYDSAGFQGGRNLLAGLPRMFTLSARAYIQ